MWAVPVQWSLSMSPLAALGTFHCVNVKHYTWHNLFGCQTLLSHTQLQYISVFSASHNVTHRFYNHLFLVMKRINLEGGWQASTATYKAELSFGTLQAFEVPPVLFPGLSSVSKKLLAYHLHWLFNQRSWLGRITITDVLKLHDSFIWWHKMNIQYTSYFRLFDDAVNQCN